MKLEYQNMDEIEIVKVSGRLTVDGASDFRNEVAERIRERCRIVFDLTEMEYIDSTGLGALVAVLQAISDVGGRMALAAIAPKLKLVFDITRADRVFAMFPTVDEALASLR